MRTAKTKGPTIRVVSFNVENFVTKPFRPKFLFNKDIILIQEWREQAGEKLLKTLGSQYAVHSVDRVAVIFNTKKFSVQQSEVFKINLVHESPTILEKTYTSDTKRYGMLSVLCPNNSNYRSIAVINGHLSAYSPNLHPNFHKKQFTDLVRKARQLVKQNCNYIIGADTNYRQGKGNVDLLNELLDDKWDTLVDVCQRNCMKKATQSFKCLHEKGTAKFLAKKYAHIHPFKNSIINDSRLDLVATDLPIKHKETKILKACDISDHSAIFCVLRMMPKHTTRNKTKKDCMVT